MTRRAGRPASVAAALSLGAAAAALSLGAAAAGAQRAAPRDAAPDPALDVLHYDLALDLPDTGRTIAGRAELTVLRRRRAGTLALDLVGMHVGAVEVNGRSARYARTDSVVRVTLPAGAGDTLRVAVRYDGAPRDGLIVTTDSLGRWRAFGDNWPTRSRNWFPGVDRPADKATVRFTVRAPVGRTVVANGTLERETPLLVPGGAAPRIETVWFERRPIPTYLMVIAAAPLARVALGETSCAAGAPACVPQTAYVAPELRGFLPGPFARAPEMLAYFASLVGPFPYEKLAHLQSSTIFGGMENASAIFYADAPYRDGSMKAGVVAHETAHQWFGDAVTERGFADLWLSEGFATYFAALWTRHADGEEAFRREMAASRRAVLASDPSRTRPVRDTAQADYLKLLNTNSYQKGGWVLHMLRAEVGDSAFFRGVRAYYAAHRDGNATTDDLRRAMETSAGRPLGWFFDQWLTRPGTAAFTLERAGPANAAGDAPYDLRQTSARPYAFALTVAEHASGRRATVRVPATQRVRVVLPAGALDVDPDVALLAEPVTAPASPAGGSR